jgi:hypothetical protein
MKLQKAIQLKFKNGVELFHRRKWRKHAIIEPDYQGRK